MATTKQQTLNGGVLRHSAAISQEYAGGVLVLIRKLCDETKRELRKIFENSQSFAMDAPADGGTVVSQSRMIINSLLDKYEPLFNRLAKKSTKRMVSRIVKNADVTLKLSLKEISSDLVLSTDRLTGPLQELVTASVNEGVSLIKLIPQKYLAEVNGAVMRSITTGNGLQDLVPFLNEKYQQNIRHARNVAMDQTRKAYSNITAGKMKSVGVKKFEWVHTGGSTHPRKDHVAMNGKIYDIDNPPVIGTMYGNEVRGLPATMPNCRCLMRPIVSFAE